jgi:imidazolonepropionase-like amidohydrolase
MMKRISLPIMTDSIHIPSASITNVWLRVETMLDGYSKQLRRNANLVYNKNEIVFVGVDLPPSDLLKPDQHQPDLDLQGYTLLPGLIEAHAHFFLEGGELDIEKRKSYLQKNSEELLKEALARLDKVVKIGIAAVRDAGDRNGVGLSLSKLYKDPSRPLMPYVDSPGAAIFHQGRYGSFMADPIENFATPRDCVKQRVEVGADRIKLIPTGIINFKKGQVTTEPQMTTEEITALVKAAKEFDRQTFAHASGDIGIDRAIDANVDSIEHGFFLTEDQLSKMRDKEIAWVPTFAPVQEQIDHADVMGWDNTIVSNLKRILDQHATSLVIADKMGVQIIAGSDAGSCGVAHGIGLLHEMELMERAGMSSLAVINAATGNSSARLGYKEKLGQIKPGYKSRFIVTKNSPIERISNLHKDKLIVFDGEVHESKEIGNFSRL